MNFFSEISKIYCSFYNRFLNVRENMLGKVLGSVVKPDSLVKVLSSPRNLKFKER